MRPALYVRVSTDEQASKGNSLYEQEERGIAYCKAMGWRQPVIYVDDGYSAKDMNRPELTRMLETVKKKEHDIVITTKLDRLSRKLLDILKLVEYFEKSSCSYASISESFDTSTSAGKLSLQVLGAVAEFERERIRERVRDNLMSLARQGKLISKASYGYSVVDGDLEVNIEESLIVKNVFKWTLEGIGPLQIAGRLNKMGIMSKNGKVWDEKVIRRMLTNETYIGQFVYNRKYRDGTVEVTRPEDEWIINEDHHEPIIDQTTFYKVKDLVESRRYVMKQHYNNERYLLTGLVWCAHCGYKMTGKEVKRPQNTKAPNVAYYYQCKGYQTRGVCFHHFAYRDELEQEVIKFIEHVATTNPKKLKLLVSKDTPKLSEIKLLEAKLTKLDSRMQKQLELYEDDEISKDDFRRARERIEKERKEIQDSIDDLRRIEAQSEQVAVQEKAKGLLEDILSTDRLKAKQGLASMIKEIKVRNGTEIEIEFRR
jgi:site-specific DNA recombinase